MFGSVLQESIKSRDQNSGVMRLKHLRSVPIDADPELADTLARVLDKKGGGAGAMTIFFPSQLSQH